MQTSQPENGTDYTVYGIYMAELICPESTSNTCPDSNELKISRRGWWDMTGLSVNPPAGTRYEVIVHHPRYPIQTNKGAKNIVISYNTVKRGFCDQIGVYSENTLVQNNKVEGGQDMGITLEYGEMNTVRDNTVTNQGMGGIYVLNNKTLVENNNVEDTQIRNLINNPTISRTSPNNSFNPNTGDIVINDGNWNTVKNNTCTRKLSKNSHQGINIVGRTYLNWPYTKSENNKILNNTCLNHLDSDIKLMTISPGLVNNTTLCNNTGKLVVTGNVTNSLPCPITPTTPTSN